MPFRSKAQQRYLFAKEPEVAKKFASETPKSAYSRMPEHVEDPYRPDNRLYARKKRSRKKSS
jgi:hypothetical protein